MCGRFAFYSDPSAVVRRFGLPASASGQARYNIAQGSWITGVRRRQDALCLEPLWWGYRPSWRGARAPEPINARVEQLATSGDFRGALQRRRCLIPADGWYAWAPRGQWKQPFYLSREDQDLLYFAALWTGYGDGSACCAIVTEPAHGVAREIHDRMPLALSDRSLELWLSPVLQDGDITLRMMRHLEDEDITLWPVSPRVNWPHHDDASLITPFVL